MPKEMLLYKVNDLKVSKINPRFVQTVMDEHSAMLKLIDLDIKKMELLINSIVENGIDNPLFIVYEKENKEYELMDGNRRLTAIKLLLDNKLLPTGEKYEKIISSCKNKSIEIEKIFVEKWDKNSDIEDLFKRISRLHVENDGTKSDWTPMAQYRFSQRINKKINPWIKTFEYYIKNDDKIDEILINKVDVYRRLLTNGNVQKLLKINNNLGKIQLENDDKIFNDIIDIGKKKNSTPITRLSIDEIEKIIVGIIEKYEPVNNKIISDDNIIEEKLVLNNFNTDNQLTINKEIADANQEKKRFEDKSEKETLDINHTKSNCYLEKKRKNKNINDKNNGMYYLPLNFPSFSECENKIKIIINELKYINILEFPYSSTLLVRTLIELSLKHFSGKTKFTYKENNLSGAISGAINQLRIDGKIDDTAHSVYNEINNKIKIIDILNDNVHDLLESSTRIEIHELIQKILDLIIILLKY